MNKIFILSTLLLAFFVSACTYTEKIRDGQTAYDRKQYSVAVKMLQKEYDKSKSRVEKGQKAYLLADSYRELNKSDQSINWYQIAYNNQYGIDALREHAFALKKAQRYDEAIIAFKELGIEIGSPYEYRREINACLIAKGWTEIKYPEYKVDLLDFNTGYADYSPQLYKDNQLVFTSDRKGSTGDDTYNWTGNAFADIYLVDLNSNSVTSFDERLNTPENEGTATFNKGFTQVVFTRCFGGKKEDAYCKLMQAEVQGSSWGLPKVIEFVEDNVNYGHPSLSADGTELYFSCNHPDGWGGYDIYVSKKTADGIWGDPQLLGRTINTIGNEKFPYVDGDTLYFSSDFHPGMGGLDIFKTYRFTNGSWAPSYNLKPPLNSGGDDFGYIVDYNAEKGKDVLQVGYFSSTRNDGIGNDDIYRFEKVIPPPEPEKPIAEEKELIYKMYLDVYVLEKIYEDPSNPNSRVLGRKPIDQATVETKIGKETKSITVGEDGLYSIELSDNTDYDFIASKESYLKNATNFTTRGIGKDPNNPEIRFEVEIVLDKIFFDKEIRLENIYYDFDESFIRDDAMPTLDELVENLNLNPQIQIQLGSHTDCRGNARYNEDLSQRRAQAAVDYLITKGIAPTRLVAKGYGKNELEINCVCTRCTEEEHQRNRRTTFKILENN